MHVPRKTLILTLAKTIMKKILPISTLLVGALLGWLLASHAARVRFERFAAAWPPEFQAFIGDVAAASEEIDKAKLEEAMQLVKQASINSLDEIAVGTFYMALNSHGVRAALRAHDTEKAMQLTQHRLTTFLEAHKRGDYDEHILKETIDDFASQLLEKE